MPSGYSECEFGKLDYLRYSLRNVTRIGLILLVRQNKQMRSPQHVIQLHNLFNVSLL